MNILEIRKIIQKLKSEYSETPFTLAKLLKIEVIFEDLGTVCGFYKTCLKQKFIVLNNELSDDVIELVLLHEIGHSILHKSVLPQFKNSHYIKNSKYEIEADLFALEFLGLEYYIENMESTGISKRRFNELINILHSSSSFNTL